MRRILLCLVSGLLTAPVTSLTFSRIEFPPTPVGTASRGQKVILTNTSSAPFSLHGVTTTEPDVFPVREDCPAALEPGDRCGAVVLFVPNKIGPITTTLTFGIDAPDTPHTVAITATGVTP